MSRNTLEIPDFSQLSDEVFEYMMDIDSPHRLGEKRDDDNAVMKWLKSGAVYTSCQNSEIVDTLDSGMYVVFQDQEGRIHSAKHKLSTDQLYWLPENHVKEVAVEIGKFWSKAKKFEEYKIKHKRGIMLVGGPGTGKTSIMNLLASTLVQNNGLVFSITNATELSWFVQFCKDHLRVIEPDRPATLLIEDIDKFMDGSISESSLLRFLDGEDSVDHIVVVATSNRYEDLNDLLLRPSRFDHVIEIEKPGYLQRETYLKHKGLEDVEASKWAKDTDGFSLAELKELFVSVKLLELDYKSAKSKINEQADTQASTTFTGKKKKPTKIGF